MDRLWGKVVSNEGRLKIIKCLKKALACIIETE